MNEYKTVESGRPIWECLSCGSVVASKETHDLFHAQAFHLHNQSQIIKPYETPGARTT